MLETLVILLVVIVIAGVLLWALDQFPLDVTLKRLARVVVVVFVVIIMCLLLLDLVGLVDFDTARRR